MADLQAALFDAPPAAEPPPAEPKLSAGRRRIVRQADALAAGWHPLTVAGQHPAGPAVGRLRLHPEAAPADDRTAPGRRCGNCWYRRVINTGSARDWPKCLIGQESPTDTKNALPPRVTRGPGSDIRAWWPACVEHSYGAPSISDDAARWVPGGET